MDSDSDGRTVVMLLRRSVLVRHLNSRHTSRGYNQKFLRTAAVLAPVLSRWGSQRAGKKVKDDIETVILVELPTWWDSPEPARVLLE